MQIFLFHLFVTATEKNNSPCQKDTHDKIKKRGEK